MPRSKSSNLRGINPGKAYAEPKSPRGKNLTSVAVVAVFNTNVLARVLAAVLGGFL